MHFCTRTKVIILFDELRDIKFLSQVSTREKWDPKVQTFQIHSQGSHKYSRELTRVFLLQNEMLDRISAYHFRAPFIPQA